MKVLIASDLHTDINETNTFKFMEDDNIDLLLIAGDISCGYKREKDFLKKFLDKPYNTVAIAGNHLGYDFTKTYGKDESNGILDKSISLLTKEFNGKVNYLHNDYRPYYKMQGDTVEEYFVFGGPMYTDFKLTSDVETNKYNALWGINDFINVKISEGKNIRTISPDNYVYWHKQFKSALRQALRKTADEPDTNFIVVSHFAPSIKCISDKYKDDSLNPFYACNMEDFILKNPRIKLWVCGHVNNSCDFMIGNCRVICEPYGYYFEKDYPAEEYSGKIIEF